MRLRWEFLSFKSRFYPHLTSKHYLDAVLAEVKGADIRRHAVHIRPEYERLRARYGKRLKQMQFLFTKDGKRRGGITVSDSLGKKPSRHLFGD